MVPFLSEPDVSPHGQSAYAKTADIHVVLIAEAAHFVGADHPKAGRRPQSVRSRIESVRNSVQIVGEEVPVTIERQGRALVPEKPLHDFEICTAADGQ